MDDLESTLLQYKDTIAKTAVTNASYTFSPATRSIFNPENLDPVVKLMVPTDTPIRALLSRSQGYGQAAAWKKLTSQLSVNPINSGGPVGTGVSGFFADGSTPNQTTQTFVVATAAYKNIGRDVEVGRQAIASSRGYQDIRDEMVRIKTLEVMLAEEDANINGDSAADGNAYDGMIKTLVTNSGTLSLLTASGIGSQVQSVYWNYGGNPDVLACNPRQVRALADDLQGSGSIQRIVVDDKGAATGGVALAKVVNPITGTLINVATSRYIGTWALLLDSASDAGEPWLEVEDLESMSVYEPPTSNHSVISRVYETSVLKVIGEVFQVKIGGLATV